MAVAKGKYHTQVTLDEAMLERLTQWRREHPKLPSLSEAIRWHLTVAFKTLDESKSNIPSELTTSEDPST